MLFLLIFSFGLTHARDLFAERRAIDNQIENERYRAGVARRYGAIMSGLGKIAGPNGIVHASSKCTMNYRDNDQQVGQLCDRHGCTPVFGKGSEGWNGYSFSTCDFVMGNGSQCFASTGYIDSKPVVSVECTKPNLDQIDYEINQDTGAVKTKSVSKRPR